MTLFSYIGDRWGRCLLPRHLRRHHSRDEPGSHEKVKCQGQGFSGCGGSGENAGGRAPGTVPSGEGLAGRERGKGPETDLNLGQMICVKAELAGGSVAERSKALD